jgi:hypothetical protein
MPLPATAPCGLWIAAPGADYIIYEQETSRVHREHIVLHEVGHLLCRHRADSAREGGGVGQLFPNLDAVTLGRIFQRTSYTTEAEREAELIASLILQRVRRQTVLPPPNLSATDVAILGRLSAALQPPAKADR